MSQEDNNTYCCIDLQDYQPLVILGDIFQRSPDKATIEIIDRGSKMLYSFEAPTAMRPLPINPTLCSSHPTTKQCLTIFDLRGFSCDHFSELLFRWLLSFSS